MLRLPAVADKTFLITIGDRSVGGLTARDQMVGPWQVQVPDVAVTTMGYTTLYGGCAIGERTPLAILGCAPAWAAWRSAKRPISSPPASPRSATSSCRPTGMTPPARRADARLFDTVRAVSDLCQSIGVSIQIKR